VQRSFQLPNWRFFPQPLQPRREASTIKSALAADALISSYHANS